MTTVQSMNRRSVSSERWRLALFAVLVAFCQVALSQTYAADSVSSAASATPADVAVAPPRRIAAGDVLQIEVVTNSRELPAPSPQVLLLRPSMVAAIGKDGLLSLGDNYGSVALIGKTINEAEVAIGATLREVLDRSAAVEKQASSPAESALPLRIITRVVYLGNDPGDDPQVFRTLVETHRVTHRVVEPGDILQVESLADGLNTRRSVVEPDGSLALGARWGRVNVSGRTLLETEAVVRAHLETHLKDPEVQVTYAGHSPDGSNPGQLEVGGPMEIIAQFQRDISDLKLMLREFRSLIPR